MTSNFFRGMFDYDVLNEGAIYFGTTVNIDQSGTKRIQGCLEEQGNRATIVLSYYLEGNFLKIDNVTLRLYIQLQNNKYVRNLRIYGGNVTNLAILQDTLV